jgi:hypothetical protein
MDIYGFYIWEFYKLRIFLDKFFIYTWLIIDMLIFYIIEFMLENIFQQVRNPKWIYF